MPPAHLEAIAAALYKVEQVASWCELLRQVAHGTHMAGTMYAQHSITLQLRTIAMARCCGVRKTSLNCTPAELRPAMHSCQCLQATALHLHHMRVAEVAVVDNLPLHMLGDGAGASGDELDGHLQGVW